MLMPMQQRECRYSSQYTGASQRGIIAIKSGDESALLSAVYSVGPVAVAVDGRSNAFKVSKAPYFRLIDTKLFNLNEYGPLYKRRWTLTTIYIYKLICPL